jgi:hypothetical protein
MVLTVKQFNVIDTSTGKVAISGRYTNAQINTIKSQYLLTNDTVERTTIAGTPDTINSSELLYGISHMSTSYIQIVRSFGTNVSNDCIFVPDGTIRISYIGGTTSASNSILYGFSPSTSTSLSSITFNVLVAKNTSQTIGDYWDIPIPDDTNYPNLYLVLVLVNSGWDSRTIVSGNTCSIPTTNIPNFCIDPSKSIYDENKSHFIILQCKNSVYGIPNRISIAIEDWLFGQTDNDYNDFLISISSACLGDAMVNDTSTS